MPQRVCRRPTMAGMFVCLLASMVWAAEGPIPVGVPAAVATDNARQTVSVNKTFDNKPFDYQIKFQSQRNGYRIYQLRYPSPVITSVEQNNTVPAEYYLPDSITPYGGKGDSPIFADHANRMVPGKSGQSPGENWDSPPISRRPAVICLHILDGNDALTDLVCSVLALRGIPAIMFKLPYYGERGLSDGPMALAKDPKLFAGALAQAGQDLRRTIDVLSSRPEVDPNRIGVTGISLGGIVAATAAGGEPRINRAAFILAGGDLMKIIHHARETKPLSEMIQKLSPADRAELEEKIAAVDPLRFASTLSEKARQGKVLMVNAAEDEVIPRACTEKLAAAMEMDNRIVWLQGLGHYTSMAELPRVLRMAADFFAQDLPPGVTPPVVEKQDKPLNALAGVLGQIATILETKPEPGRCHVVDIEVTVPRKDQTPQQGRFRLIRGSQGKFAFFCKLPAGTEISIGQNDHPWMATGAKEIYDGTENPAALKDPLELLGPKRVALLRMLSGILKSIALAPDVLDRLIVAEDDGIIDGVRAIQISARDKIPGSIRLLLKKGTGSELIEQKINKKEGSEVPVPFFLKPEEYTPQSLTLNIAGTEGNVKFVAWQINAVAQDALFQPPADLPRRSVEQSFLYTLFSTSLSFALGSGE